jgi:cytochrome c oxidase accessory protein FixG
MTSETFRDAISTVDNKGERVWIYPKKPSGRFHRARAVVAAFLILFLIAAPLIKVNNQPLLLFNILERKFVLFGLAFGPHDFHIFVVGFIALIIFIVLFTAIYGRLFCGWICPQTVFMEMVFRKIEYWIEGDANKQKILDKSAWNKEKIIKKTAKHSIFFTIAFLISNLFLAYIIGVEELLNYVTHPPGEHFATFVAVLGFAGVFYFIFARFREQACVIVCPYGRLQGVLLDENSLAVAYDFVRGEPRGKLKRDTERTEGDCIDCYLCVHVCPTGIDIRNGIQLECVNCTACIDVCDEVMDKINKPRGLIRYDSLKGIKEKIRFKFTPRIISYSVLLFLLLTVFVVLLLNRTDIDIKILRTPGMLYQDQPGEKISNLYNLNIVNKTFDELKISFDVKELDAEVKIIGDEPTIKPQEKYESKFLLLLNKKDLSKLNTPIEIGIIENGKEIKTVKTSFLSHVGVSK